MKPLILLMAIVLLLNYSCTRNDADCGPVEFTPVDFSKYSSVQIKDDKVEEVLLVINTQAEFEQNVFLESEGDTGYNLSHLNYDRHTLLIGKTVATSIPGTVINQTFKKECDRGSYSYGIKVQNGGYTALGNVFFGIIVPKINKEVRLSVDLLNRN